MKNKLLFSHWGKLVGLMLFLLFATLLYLWNSRNFSIPIFKYEILDKGSISSFFEDGDYTNEFIFGGLLFALILLAFSREKIEDERTTAIRLQSLHLSHYINYVLLAIWIIGTSSFAFLAYAVMLPYIFLVVFVFVYHFRLHVAPRIFNNAAA